MAILHRCGPLALLLAGCTFTSVTPTPLLGPAPSLVLVLPPRNGTGMPDLDLRLLGVGADTALRDRGYRVLPQDVGRDLLRQNDVEPEPSPAALQRLQLRAGVDAVLAIDARTWRVDGEPPNAADWDLDWTLRATEHGEVLWQHADAGAWRRPLRPPVDPTRAMDAEPEVVPFGSSAPATFRSASELVLALHRSAMAYLPRREP